MISAIVKKSLHVGFETALSSSVLVFDSIKSGTLMSAKLLTLHLVLQGIQMALDLSEAVIFGIVCLVTQQSMQR